MVFIRKNGRTIDDSDVASNSLVISAKDLVSRVSGFITKADGSAAIVGISNTTKTFGATNQTVQKDRVVFKPKNPDLKFELTTTTAITQANVGSSFNINASQQAVTSAGGTQVTLVEVLSANKGVFVIA